MVSRTVELFARILLPSTFGCTLCRIQGYWCFARVAWMLSLRRLWKAFTRQRRICNSEDRKEWKDWQHSLKSTVAATAWHGGSVLTYVCCKQGLLRQYIETSVFTSSIFATRSHISSRSAKGQGFLSQMVMQVSPVSLVMPLLILWAWTIGSFSHFWSNKSCKLMSSNFQRRFRDFSTFFIFFPAPVLAGARKCVKLWGRTWPQVSWLSKGDWYDMICMVLRWGFMIRLLQIHSEHVSRVLLLDDLADHFRFKFWRWWVSHPKKFNINCIKFSRRWAFRDQCQEQGFLVFGW